MDNGLHTAPGEAVPAPGYQIEKLEDVEREHILAVVRVLGFNGSIKPLGIGKTTLYRKLALYRSQGFSVDRQAAGEAGSFYWLNLMPEQLAPLFKHARTAAEYLQRCVGTAKILGEELGIALDRVGAPHE